MEPSISLFNASLDNGGASLAFRRHFDSLIQHAPSKYAFKAFTDNPNKSDLPFINPQTSDRAIRFKSFVHALNRRLYRYLLNPDPDRDFYPADGFLTQPSFSALQSSLLHLFWTQSYISPKAISRLSLPVVITLHDMWHFTGGCAYSLDCEQFYRGCRNCKYARRLFRPAISRSALIKQQLLQKDNVYFVATSYWIHKHLRTLGVDPTRLSKINNYIPPIYQKFLPRSDAQQLLGWSESNLHQYTFYFVGDIRSKRKGFDMIIKAITSMSPDERALFKIQILGTSPYKRIKEFDQLAVTYTCLGSLKDQLSQSLAYNSADMLICPSIFDNSPNIVAEAAMCGLPTICFERTGAAEMVQQLITGIVIPKSPDLLAGVMLDCARKRHILNSETITAYASSRYSYSVTTAKYCSLYDRILMS